MKRLTPDAEARRLEEAEHSSPLPGVAMRASVIGLRDRVCSTVNCPREKTID
jgi:hypothetical protein